MDLNKPAVGLARGWGGGGAKCSVASYGPYRRRATTYEALTLKSRILLQNYAKFSEPGSYIHGQAELVSSESLYLKYTAGGGRRNGKIFFLGAYVTCVTCITVNGCL